MNPIMSSPLRTISQHLPAKPHYIGRFAPSPSGDLHFGSLVTALGSYLQARAQQGTWLLRIEDIDPPREVPGSIAGILRTLERYQLFWDGEVLYQSQRYDAYRAILDQLLAQRLAYCCHCTRKRIHALGGIYDGHCRLKEQPFSWQNSVGHAALRLYQQHPVYGFTDQLRGYIATEHALAEEDFIIHRKDGLFAYNLAVVVDDHFQGISEIVRGADLIEPTVRQMALYHQLGWQHPTYLHLPLALNSDGNKLSKQNHAPPISMDNPRQTLIMALTFLGQDSPTQWQDLTLTQLLDWAVAHWQTEHIPRQIP